MPIKQKNIDRIARRLNSSYYEHTHQRNREGKKIGSFLIGESSYNVSQMDYITSLIRVIQWKQKRHFYYKRRTLITTFYMDSAVDKLVRMYSDGYEIGKKDSMEILIKLLQHFQRGMTEADVQSMIKALKKETDN